MKKFEYVNAGSILEATEYLGSDHSAAIAGGTDLLSRMKAGTISPARLVNLKTIPELDYIRFDEKEGLWLGALATLDKIASSPIITEKFGILSRAISLSASPQLRNRGTIGGNLNQAPRCWYFRGPFHCWLKGGKTCYAREGENTHHAVFGQGPCNSVHPSDPALALIAVNAVIHIAGPGSGRNLPLEQYFQSPRRESRQLTILNANEIVTGLKIPNPPRDSRGTYLKATERRVWSFAQASLAAFLILDGDRIQDIRLVLGGVASSPRRLTEAESVLRGLVPDKSLILQAAELSISGARPLEHNGYKLPLIKGLIIEALNALK